MKLYKSLLFGLLVCGMAACDTTDLERDINSLKDRVEDYEAQVQKLNDDMNIIRVLLDGNKTITSYSFDGANYTLTLSNGETLTLTQGVVGANYPSITIGENGNWVIAGTDSGIRAEAKDGEDAPYTPQFKIENENWCVSLDGGATWQNLGVKATGTASGTSPISSVTPATDGNSIKITLAEGNTYTIPVVKDLVCEITEPELAEGEMWYIGTDGATLKVRVNIQSGDIIRPIVPADWEAEIVTDYSSLSGEQTLEVKVTPLSGASKCVVTMEVNRGANTVTDEIVARTEIANYWDEYQAGMDIVVGDPNGVHMVINKKNINLTVKHITSSSTDTDKQIAAEGIYFVDSDVTGVSYKRFGLKNLIIIGTDVDKQSKLPVSDYFNIGREGGKGLALKNIEMDLSSYTAAYVVNAGNEESTLDYVIFDQCKAAFPNTGNKNFNVVQLSNKANIHIKNIVFYGNKFAFNPSTGNTFLVNLSPADGTKYSGYESFTCSNNVIYASQSGQGISNFSLLQANLDETKLDVIFSLSVNHNTFVNLFSKNAMMRTRAVNVVSNANLMWNDYDNADSRSWLFLTKRADEAVELGQLELTGNTVYDQTANKKNWIVIHENGYRPGNYTDYTLNYLDVNPFDGGTFDITNGVFKVSAAYEGIGASLD